MQLLRVDKRDNKGRQHNPGLLQHRNVLNENIRSESVVILPMLAKGLVRNPEAGWFCQMAKPYPRQVLNRILKMENRLKEIASKSDYWRSRNDAAERWLAQNDPRSFRKCRKCADGFMIEKSGKFGVFFSCSNAPRCFETISKKQMKKKSRRRRRSN